MGAVRVWGEGWGGGCVGQVEAHCYFWILKNMKLGRRGRGGRGDFLRSWGVAPPNPQPHPTLVPTHPLPPVVPLVPPLSPWGALAMPLGTRWVA